MQRYINYILIILTVLRKIQLVNATPNFQLSILLSPPRYGIEVLEPSTVEISESEISKNKCIPIQPSSGHYDEPLLVTGIIFTPSWQINPDVVEEITDASPPLVLAHNVPKGFIFYKSLQDCEAKPVGDLYVETVIGQGEGTLDFHSESLLEIRYPMGVPIPETSKKLESMQGLNRGWDWVYADVSDRYVAVQPVYGSDADFIFQEYLGRRRVVARADNEDQWVYSGFPYITSMNDVMRSKS